MEARGVQLRPSTLAGKLIACLLVAAGLVLLAGESRSDPYVYAITQNADDGTEVSGCWHESGYASFCNTIGRGFAKIFFAGLRYHVSDLEQGQTVKYARLRFPAQGGQNWRSKRGNQGDGPGANTHGRDQQERQAKR